MSLTHDPSHEDRITALEEAVKQLRAALNASVSVPVGSSGNMTLTEPPIIGRVTPKNDFANVRDKPNTASPILYKLHRTFDAMNFAEVVGTVQDLSGAGPFIWYTLRGGGYVREDVVDFSAITPLKDAVSQPPLSTAKWPAPIAGYHVTNTHHNERHHEGVDLAAPIGTPIYSSPDGGYVAKVFRCVPCGDDPQGQRHTGTSEAAYGYGYGHYVIVRYTNHPAENQGHFLFVMHAHLSQIHVTQGQVLTPGFMIGEVGLSGNTYGAKPEHLHMECRVSDNPQADWYSIRGNAVDPETVFEI